VSGANGSSRQGKNRPEGADEQRWDFATSVEEVMTHLHVYVMAKQVLYLGISDTPAWVVVKANECGS
jgi:aryl-alcohol dehydrogenase-like predicted oxidoreductase